MELKFATWQEIDAYLEESQAIVMPIGATEPEFRGPPIDGKALMWGVLSVTGEFNSESDGNYYGSVIAVGGIYEAGGSESPHIYWDASLKDGWPAEWGIAQFVVTRWETEL